MTQPILHDLAWVRRLEAAGFRAWPAASLHYDRAFMVRLHGEHSAKRLNSINFLDPQDTAQLELRLEKLESHFKEFNRPVVIRQTPLTPRDVRGYCLRLGWQEHDFSVVLKSELSLCALDVVDAAVPIDNTQIFVDIMAQIDPNKADQKEGLKTIIDMIIPKYGLFASYYKGVPVACCIAVRERGVVGLFEVATHPDYRRKGHGRALMLRVLKWAQEQGAHTAWLQVVADNHPAQALYKHLGFEQVYRYSYWYNK